MLLQGLDCSSYQGQPDWHAVAAAGYSFAITKASEGSNISDPTFAYNFAGIKAANMVRGCYHFGRVANDPANEARFFLGHLPALDAGDIIALDLEEGNGDLSQWARTWLDTVEAALGFPPILYTSPDYAMNHLAGAGLSRFNLWLADLSRSRTSCGQWGTIAMRQYSWEGRVPGINGNVDLDELARDVAGLKKLGKPGAAPPVQPPAPKAYEVSKAGNLKAQPSHKDEHIAKDGRGKDVFLPVGAVVIPIGAAQTTDDTWLPVKLPPPSNVHGYYPKANIAPDTDA